MTIDELKTKLPKQPVFKIDFTGEQVGYKNSKLGGKYYWTDENGLEGYIFLAQINFSELPANDIFPKTGLLQFFVLDDDDYGLFADGKGFRVIYHQNLDNGYEVYRQPENTPLYNENIGLTFTLSEEYLTASDYRMEDFVEDMEDDIWENFDGSGSKLLGYPYFTQYDPRENGVSQTYDRLLFQLDTNKYLMWGDSGVANFFINSEKLANLDFSDILYNWDCC